MLPPRDETKQLVPLANRHHDPEQRAGADPLKLADLHRIDDSKRVEAAAVNRFRLRLFGGDVQPDCLTAIGTDRSQATSGLAPELYRQAGVRPNVEAPQRGSGRAEALRRGRHESVANRRVLRHSREANLAGSNAIPRHHHQLSDAPVQAKLRVADGGPGQRRPHDDYGDAENRRYDRGARN